MPELHYRDGGAWRKARELHYRDGGVWRKIKEAWYRDGGVWRRVFAGHTLLGAAYGYVHRYRSGLTAIATANFNPDGTVTSSGSGTSGSDIAAGTRWASNDPSAAGVTYYIRYSSNGGASWSAWQALSAVVSVSAASSVGTPNVYIEYLIELSDGAAGPALVSGSVLCEADTT